MANHKSAQKRIRQNKIRNLRNRSQRSAYRTEIKKFTALLDNKQAAEALAALSRIHRLIDKACTKNLLSKNAASRKKSRLAIRVNALQG